MIRNQSADVIEASRCSELFLAAARDTAAARSREYHIRVVLRVRNCHGRSIRNFKFVTAAVRGPEGIVSVSLCEFLTVTAAPFVIARSLLLLESIRQLDVTREKSALQQLYKEPQ